MSAFHPLATTEQTSLVVRFVPIAEVTTLFYHLGADQNGIWDRQAQQLCRPGIDDQLVGGGLLNRNVPGPGAL